jgi:hypothetical protein
LSRKLGDRSDTEEAEWGMMGACTETGEGEGPRDILNQAKRERGEIVVDRADDYRYMIEGLRCDVTNMS